MTRVALINTGGTIASNHPDPLEVMDYAGTMLTAEELLARLPPLPDVEWQALPFAQEYSINMGYSAWKRLVDTCHGVAQEQPDLQGIVIAHGTASLEETAWFLNLTLKIPQTVVIVGSQRPASAYGTDGAMNLLNAMRVAAAPAARGRGVLVMLNDEIHAAREVTKTATFRLQTFRSPDFGVLGHVDGPSVAFYRKTERPNAPDTEFDISELQSLPRVDIFYSHADADGVALDAFLAAGAKGIVCAGFAPGTPSFAQIESVRRAVDLGVPVVQSTRAGSGIVHETGSNRRLGLIAADNLNPQKARILLSLLLTRTNQPDDIRRGFLTY